MKKIFPVLALSISACFTVNSIAQNQSMTPSNSVLNGEHRSAKNKLRDKYRHPVETLTFFGVEPGMKVIEIWPGGGWYTEILAPMLGSEGQLVAAHFYSDSTSNYYKKSRKSFEQKIAAHKVYDNVKLASFYPGDDRDFVNDGSADLVLTFRNLHNWYMQKDSEGAQKAFNMFFKALKPGGVLGVVDHELPESMDQEASKNSGYMHKALAIKWAEKAGFKFVAESSINKNPKDNAMHPRGVWTLPPSLRLGEENKDKYLAIGESNRMTLKFIKPM